MGDWALIYYWAVEKELTAGEVFDALKAWYAAREAAKK